MSYIQWIRSQLGHRKIFLAFASIVLRDTRGRILLQHRTDFDVWGLPGGCLELGEDILSCARRELLEETGLSAGALALVGVYSQPDFESTYPNGDQVQQYTVCFQGLVSGGEMRPDGVETCELAFFTPEELRLDTLPVWYAAMISDAQRLYPMGGEPAYPEAVTGANLSPQIQTVRQFIGHAPYIGVGASGVTVREDGRLLVAKRTDNGLWHFPGGFMDLGESVTHTVVREIHEETGLWVQPERLLGVYSPRQVWSYPNGDQTQAVLSLFRCRLLGGEEHPDLTETSQVGWMTPQEILAATLHPLLTPLHQTILQHLDRPNHDRQAFVL